MSINWCKIRWPIGQDQEDLFFYKRTGLFQIKIKNPNHNHPPSQNPSVHPIHRRLKPDQKHLVEQLTHAG
ncbi:hypothetical protein MJO28_000808, partial [Puccinia striiformis f. sp. tritici]